MPGFDQSGPNGKGPLTGRQRGMYQRTDNAGFNISGGGRGGRRRMRLGVAPRATTGRGMRRMGTAGNENVNSGESLESLKTQYESAREMIEILQDKIAVLEAQQK